MRTYEEIAADARPGPAFSNGTEWEYWADRRGGCYYCRNDDMGVGGDEKCCPIFSVSLIERTIPREWTTAGEIRRDYTCTEYDERPDDGDDDGEPEPGPPPVIAGQVDMFEVFTEQLIEALPAPEAVAR